MGGVNPTIVFNDCDFDKTVDTCMIGAFCNSGQVCTSSDRLFVQEGIYDKFVEELVKRTRDVC